MNSVLLYFVILIIGLIIGYLVSSLTVTPVIEYITTTSSTTSTTTTPISTVSSTTTIKQTIPNSTMQSVIPIISNNQGNLACQGTPCNAVLSHSTEGTAIPIKALINNYNIVNSTTVTFSVTSGGGYMIQQQCSTGIQQSTLAVCVGAYYVPTSPQNVTIMASIGASKAVLNLNVQ